MEFIEQLQKERTELQKRIDAIDVLLNAYGFVPASVDKKTSNPEFPRSGRTDKQILWLFENHFKTAVRMGDVNDAYNAFNGTKDEAVDNITRRLKKENRLSMVKYNGQNKLTFYGLPTWVAEDNFKPEYRPDEDKLPLDVLSSEVVI